MQKVPWRKILKLVAVIAAFAAAWLYLLYYSHRTFVDFSPTNWITPAVILVIAIPLTALASITLEPRLFFLVSIGLSFSYLFFFPLSIYTLISILLLFLGFWRAYHRTQFELHNNIKFAPSHIGRGVASIILLAFFLGMAFNVYAVAAGSFARDESGFYSRLAQSVTKGILPILERQLPGFEPQLTLDQYLINSLGGVSNVLPLEAQESQLEQKREQLLASLGISATGGEQMSRIVQLVAETKIQELVENLKKRMIPLSALLPALYALVIFSLLRVLALFVSLAAQVLGAILFWILRLTGFLHVSTVQILAEQVTL